MARTRTTSTEWAIPEGWAATVYDSLETFRVAAGRRKHQIASALGVDPASLALSHLADPQRNRYLYQQLPYALRRERFWEIARLLRLDPIGCEALKRLVSEILSACTGYRLSAEALFDRRNDILERGRLGIDQFLTGDWKPGTLHLSQAWEALSLEPPTPDDAGFSTYLQIGSAWLGWQGYAGQSQETLRCAKQLLQRVRDYRGTAPDGWLSVCKLYKACGIALRHAHVHPDYSVDLQRRSYRLAVAHTLSPSIRCAALRDQAKPLMAWGWDPERGPDPNRASEAIEVLMASEREVGEEREPGQDDELRREWLFSRLTQVECLAAWGDADRALRMYEDAMEQAWAETLLAKAESATLSAKRAFAEIAVLAGQRNLDTLCERTSQFARSPVNAGYGERTGRARDLQDAATAGNEMRLRLLLVK